LLNRIPNTQYEIRSTLLHNNCPCGRNDDLRCGFKSVVFARGDDFCTDGLGLGRMDEGHDAAAPAATGEAGAKRAGFAGGLDDDVEFFARVLERGSGGFVRVVEKLAECFKLAFC